MFLPSVTVVLHVNGKAPVKTLHVRTVSLVSLCSIHEDINCNDIILVLWIYVLFSPLRLSDQFGAAISTDNRPS